MSPGQRSNRVLSDYVDDCRTLDAAAFQQAHGEAFLLHHGPFGKLSAPRDGDSTLDLEQPAGQDGAALKPSADFLVLPLTPPNRGGSPPDMIWIGRSDANEVVIPDATISEVHAFIRREPDGFLIQDTGSRNGTWVNDLKVKPQGMGDPSPLPAGARVRFGSVKMTFLLAEQFRALVLGLLG